MKSEPTDCSIDDLAAMPNQTIAWYGVRNYQARNYMRDEMSVGDLAFFYHSSCPKPGIAGIVCVASAPFPDETQFDPKHRFFDPKSAPETPRWHNVEVRLVEKTPFVSLNALKEQESLLNMIVLQKANRLSISPVAAEEWRAITRLMAPTALS